MDLLFPTSMATPWIARNDERPDQGTDCNSRATLPGEPSIPTEGSRPRELLTSNLRLTGDYLETAEALRSLNVVASEFQIDADTLELAITVVYGLAAIGIPAPKVWSHGNKSVVLDLGEQKITVSTRAISGLRVPDETTGWQPIHTAPQHYTPVLLKQGGVVGEGCFHTHLAMWEFFNSSHMTKRAPTHWRHLPAADESSPEEPTGAWSDGGKQWDPLPEKASVPLREPQPDDFWTCGMRDWPAYKAAHDEWKRKTSENGGDKHG